MTINKNLLSSSKYSLKSLYSMTPIGVCVHNTANDSSAKGEIAYMISNTASTSFHFAVDDIEIWQGLPLDRNGWHAGDGTNGDGNRKHIGIEICYSKSGGDRFIKAEQNTAQLIADLLKQYGWGIDRVKKHQDFSSYGKYCPHRTLDMGWDRFLNLVKSKMEGNMDYEKLYNEARVARDQWWQNMSKLIKATGLDFTEATANAKTDEAVKRITDWIANLKTADARVTELTQQLNVSNNNTLELAKKLSAETQSHKETYLKLQECENRPIGTPTQPSLNGRLNGYTKQYEKDGAIIVENYAIDG